MIVRMLGACSRRAACAFVISLVAGVLVAPGANAASPSSEIHSVVVLGDSVAAGEGTLDGYRYQDRVLLPSWSEAAARRAYDGSRPSCHQSPRAFGRVVARTLGAEYTTFACSGATFDRGINLDTAYDRAKPDLVLVTAGANSVDFERVFAYCVLASRGLSDTDAARIAGAPDDRRRRLDGTEHCVDPRGGTHPACCTGLHRRQPRRLPPADRARPHTRDHGRGPSTRARDP